MRWLISVAGSSIMEFSYCRFHYSSLGRGGLLAAAQVPSQAVLREHD
jgi:hypothetical protein